MLVVWGNSEIIWIESKLGDLVTGFLQNVYSNGGCQGEEKVVHIFMVDASHDQAPFLVVSHDDGVLFFSCKC